jgi:hypothetical protein
MPPRRDWGPICFLPGVAIFLRWVFAWVYGSVIWFWIANYVLFGAILFGAESEIRTACEVSSYLGSLIGGYE